MSRSADFIAFLEKEGIEMFTGVPDSLLGGFISSLPAPGTRRHVITANEGAAVAFAAGYHLSTGKTALVYLQNSGLGNIINPLTSMADREVYGIPMLLMIGWRGRPGVKDEPQHMKMGAISPALLDVLEIPFFILSQNAREEWARELGSLLSRAVNEKQPVAVLVEDNFFESEVFPSQNSYPMSSEDAIGILCDSMQRDDIVICTTGKIGRVFYKLNKEGKKVDKYFLNVGSMGHAISIAAAVAGFRSNKIFVLDGDGSLLMHMGALTLPPSLQLRNFHYILFNNGSHQSVGGQPTVGFEVDFCAIAKGCGYRQTKSVEDAASLKALSNKLSEYDFIEIRINCKTNEPLPRPAETPRMAKEDFMKKGRATP